MANVRNNWLSGGLTFAGGGIKYERMFNSKFSLGIDVYFQAITLILLEHGEYELGGAITAWFYPFGKILYLGVGLGLDYQPSVELKWNDAWDFFGFAITPELGVKIDFGNPGDFFMDIGLKVPQIIGTGQTNIYDNFNNFVGTSTVKGYLLGFVPYIGFGWAF